MAEVAFHPTTGHLLAIKPASGRGGEPFRWGLVESGIVGFADVPDEAVANGKLRDLKADVTKFTAKQKADLADPKKVAKFTVTLIEKTAEEKAAKVQPALPDPKGK